MCTAVPHVTCNQQHATGSTPGTFQSFCGHCFSGKLHVKRHDLDAKSCDQRPEGGGCSPRAIWLVGDELVGLQLAHDLELPGTRRPKLGFLLYPQAKTGAGRLDCLDADTFKYTITAREVSA